MTDRPISPSSDEITVKRVTSLNELMISQKQNNNPIRFVSFSFHNMTCVSNLKQVKKSNKTFLDLYHFCYFAIRLLRQ